MLSQKLHVDDTIVTDMYANRTIMFSELVTFRITKADANMTFWVNYSITCCFGNYEYKIRMQS